MAFFRACTQEICRPTKWALQQCCKQRVNYLHVMFVRELLVVPVSGVPSCSARCCVLTVQYDAVKYDVIYIRGYCTTPQEHSYALYTADDPDGNAVELSWASSLRAYAQPGYTAEHTCRRSFKLQSWCSVPGMVLRFATRLHNTILGAKIKTN